MVTRSVSRIALSALLLSATFGCASTQTPEPEEYTEAAEYSYARAQNFMERRDYDRARAIFLNTAREYPFSRFAALSELGVADSFFREELYPSAIENYRRFQQLHPSHEQVPYAAFKVVEAFSELMPRDRFLMPPVHERDLTDARLAYVEASRYQQRFGDSEYAEQAAEILQQVADRLAAHELYIANYYARREQHLAVARRCQYLVDAFAESSLVPEALALQARSAIRGEDPALAAEAIEALEERHADSTFAAQLPELRSQLDALETRLASAEESGAEETGE